MCMPHPVIQPPPPHERVSTLRTTLSPGEITARLESLARRGKLAGYESPVKGVPGALFAAAAFGQVFDYRLVAHADTPSEKGTMLRFSLVPVMRGPLIFWAAMALTVWPGVWLTDSMLTSYFSWYTIDTWKWYLPLTVLPLPFMWRKMSKTSLAAAVQHSSEQVEKIAQEIGGEPRA